MKHVFEPDGIDYLDRVERCRRCDMPKGNDRVHDVKAKPDEVGARVMGEGEPRGRQQEAQV